MKTLPSKDYLVLYLGGKYHPVYKGVDLTKWEWGRTWRRTAIKDCWKHYRARNL